MNLVKDNQVGIHHPVNYGPPQQQQPMGGYSQPQPMGGNSQPQPMGGYSQPQPMGGYSQSQPMGYANQVAQQSSSNTTIIVQPFQQPVQRINLLIAPVKGHRDWTTGLFNCFSDMGVCWFTCFCYSCALCQLASRTGECSCTTCCVPASDINLRTRIRTLGGIKGSMCDDCCVVSCCSSCAACQESRELTAMGIP